MSEAVYVVAVLKAKEGRLDDLKSTLSTLAGETRKEKGAIEYFFVHDEHQDANTIVSYEKWKNAEEEAAHWKTAHLRNAIEAMKGILDGDPVIHRGPRVI